MHKRGLKVALVAVLTLIFVLGAVGVAFAQWTDLTMSILGDYGITEQQVANISDGFPDGSWQPYQAMPRKQFVKMAVDAYQIPLVTPATPTYSDVPASNYYYSYIEGATAAGLTNGVGGGKFEPDTIITREQAVAIISRWVADKNGYDLETMYTDADAAAILSAYPDASAVGPSLVKEMAFAVDFGIVWGTDSGDLAPKLNMSRIQGAAMLIRSLDIIPTAEPEVPVVPTKIVLVPATADEAENLIGLTHQYTYKVTQADGSPAPGVLVDFDTLMAQTYVGNVQPEAVLTDENGEATVNLISTEVGIQRVSAAVNHVPQIWSTKYWLALDEVYILDETREAENNAGETHTWKARVVVFGPGPLSTSANDWYNAIGPDGDPADADEMDGVDWPYGFVLAAVNNVYQNLLPLDLSDFDSYDALIAWAEDFIDTHSDSPQTLIDIVNTLASVDRWTFDTERIMALHGFTPRTMADVPVQWQIAPLAVLDDPDTTVDESVASVGTIVAATEDGEIAADGQSAWAKTDADGVSTIDITSEKTGATPVSVQANYEGNPYEWQLFSHFADLIDTHFTDWDDQPMPQATAWKTWIPHVIGGDDAGPITPVYAVNNTGEVEVFTLKLEDTFGNVIPGYTVEWWIQGVGEFKNDGTTWSGLGEQNKDVDITDANGEASVMVKSLVPGQTIVHAKVMDKFGLPYKEWNVVKQWYSIDDVRFIDKLVWVDADHDGVKDTGEMVIPVNLVNTSHTFTVEVSGAKYVYTIYDLNDNGLRDDTVLIGDRANMKAVAGVYANFDGTIGASKAAGVDVAVGIPFRPAGGNTWYIRFADMDLADTEFFVDRIGSVQDARDGVKEVWSVLEGKGINFFTNIGGDATAPYTDGTPWTTVTSNTSLPTAVAAPAAVQRVGSITGFAPAWVDRTVGGTLYHYNAVTDADGQATVTINSTVKGYQYVWAVADYPENPQNGNAAKPLEWYELRRDVATKLWSPDTTTPNIRVFANAAAPFATGDVWVNPVLAWTYSSLGSATVLIGAPDMAAGVAPVGITATVAGGVVTFGGTTLPTGSGYTNADLNRPVTAALGTAATADSAIGVVGLTNNAVVQIHVLTGGSGYTTAPAVTIAAPDIVGGTQATATANIAGGSVVSVTITNNGSGYSVAPIVTFPAGTAITTVGTITGVAGGAVSALTPAVGTFANGGPFPVTVPAPLRTQATGTAAVTAGVVTSLALTNPGAGYSIAPAVNISGSGSGALAHATVAGGVLTGLVLDAGGSGYAPVVGIGGTQVSDTADDANPNREVIAVQIFDQYGNALPDYFVTWEILGQNTTTPGTINTYHPYAHFMNDDADPADAVYDPAHDDPNTLTNPGIVAVSTAGTGDRQRHVDSNPIWDNGPAPYGDADDDMAWGWTLDGQINNTLDLASAAHVTLILDQTAAELAGRAHITSIVNVKVYTPTGTLIEDFEVTKEWSLQAPVLSKINLSVGTSATGPWVTSLATNISPLFYRAELLDQFNNPWTSNVNVRVKIAGPTLDNVVFVVGVPDASGIVIANIPAGLTVAGLHTLTAFYDVNPADSLVSPGEVQSNQPTITIQ